MFEKNCCNPFKVKACWTRVRFPPSPPETYLQTVRLFVKKIVLQDEVCF